MKRPSTKVFKKKWTSRAFNQNSRQMACQGIKIFIVFFLLSFYGFLLAKPVDFTTADLGRHLKNGEIVLQEGPNAFKSNSVLNSNFYSYAHLNFPFINHHWLSGVVFFVIKKFVGLTGLSIFYIFLSLLCFLIFFVLAKNQADFKTAAFASLILIPLIAQRKEIRPEVFGYLFGAIFLLLLTAYQKGKLAKSRLLLLPPLILIWVNLHLSFFIGLFLIAAFLFEELIYLKKRGTDQFKWLSFILLLSFALSFLNPNTWRGAIYPLKIFENYGYRVVENQSIWFLEKYGFNEPNLRHFEVILAILVLTFIILLIKNRQKIQVVHLSLAIIFSLMAWFALRNLTLFGFFMLPVLAFNFKNITPKKIQKDSLKYNSMFIILFMTILVLIDLNSHDYLVGSFKTRGLGVVPKNKASTNFFIQQNLKGPIFNNYDIGSFLIYRLYPQEKIFIGNRPEAYPKDFFQETYIPMQEDDEVWKKQDLKYNFNVIFFQYHDLTPWAQEFLITRVNDPTWAPVFVDSYVIIFLKRNQLNESVIKKYEIPKQNFRVLKK